MRYFMFGLENLLSFYDKRNIFIIMALKEEKSILIHAYDTEKSHKM